jgi:hypothetical protein
MLGSIQIVNMDSSQKIDSNIRKLAQQMLRSDKVPPKTLERIYRLIRPTSNDVLEHSNAIKIRIRRTLLSKYADENEGPGAVASFDREVDSLRRMNSKNIASFLALLEPLCFSSSHKAPIFEMPTAATTKIDDAPIEVKEIMNTVRKSVPIGVPPPLSEDEITLISDKTLWVSRDVEMKILRDLLLIFQVNSFLYLDNSIVFI